jgi:hypothetical protein
LTGQGETAYGEADLKATLSTRKIPPERIDCSKATDVLARIARKEAELAAVDAEEGTPSRALGHAEEGAVAADHAAGVGSFEVARLIGQPSATVSVAPGFLGQFLDRARCHPHRAWCG